MTFSKYDLASFGSSEIDLTSYVTVVIILLTEFVEENLGIFACIKRGCCYDETSLCY